MEGRVVVVGGRYGGEGLADQMVRLTFLRARCRSDFLVWLMGSTPSLTPCKSSRRLTSPYLY